MVKFREKKNGNVWDIYEQEHIEHFRSNPRFEEIKEKKKKKSLNCLEQEGEKNNDIKGK